jgi:hypothetical protein
VSCMFSFIVLQFNLLVQGFSNCGFIWICNIIIGGALIVLNYLSWYATWKVWKPLFWYMCI